MIAEAEPSFTLQQALPERHAVILVVDLVESVRLMELDEAGFVARLQTFVAQVVGVVLPAHAGRLVKSTGDGLLMEFSSAVQAVHAAAAMHRWLATEAQPLASGQRLSMRAGLHASRIFDATIDIYGAGVNLASRVAALVEGGETAATVEARDLLHDPLDADIEDLGDCHLKHIDRPIRVYRLGPPMAVASMPKAADLAAELLVSIAVLPFSNPLAPTPSMGMGDLIADGVIDQLSQSPGLRVVSRLSSMSFRGREAALDTIAMCLGVRYVVSGTFTVIGDRVIIGAELSDATTSMVLWSGRSGGPWRDLLDIHSALIHELAEQIHRSILNSAVAKAVVRPLPTLRSYELFLGGVALMHRASAHEFETSHRLLESLTERHRRIALPHAWLGKWHVLQSIRGAALDLPRAASLALNRTGRALDLEPTSALALAIEGFVYCHLKKDLRTADLRLREACGRNPSESFAWLFLAVLHAFKGESAAALEAARRAVVLSPMDPLRYYTESLMGSCEFGAGNYVAAVQWCESSMRRNRQHLSTLRVLIAAHMALDHGDQARRVAAELLRIKPDYTVAAYEAHSVAALYPFGQQIARAMREAGIP